MIRFNTRSRIAFVSSYPPRMCGIAMFTSYLIENMILASNGSFQPVVSLMKLCLSLDHIHSKLRAFEHCNLHGTWEGDVDIEVTE